MTSLSEFITRLNDFIDVHLSIQVGLFYVPTLVIPNEFLLEESGRLCVIKVSSLNC